MQNPPIKILLTVFCLVLARPAFAQSPDKAPNSAPAVSTAPIIISGLERELRKSDIEVYSKVTGIATAQDTYDLFAPFDGRVEEVMAELFDFITPENAVARMASTEMAALLDSTTPEGKKQTERRWQDIYKYYDIKPESQGIVTNVYAQPKTKVYKGDRLFTVSRKVMIIGKNMEALYSQMAPGMTAEMLYAGDNAVKLKTKLVDFIPLEGSPLYNRVWLEAVDLCSGIRIGERFNGYLFVGRSETALLAPTTALIEKNGRKYLMLEVKTGLSTEAETELLKSGLHFLSPAE
jgi:hypothetical protein